MRRCCRTASVCQPKSTRSVNESVAMSKRWNKASMAPRSFFPGLVGACVGLRGQRVKNIVRELNNEKVDIIRWDPNVRTFITNALAPAKLKAFEINETSKRVKITVSVDQLSLAIGKRGQNAWLTSKLTGWQVDIEPEVVVTK